MFCNCCITNFIQSVSEMHFYFGRMLNVCKKCFSQEQDKRPRSSLAENSPSPFAKEICCFRQTDEFLHLLYSEKRKDIHLSCKMVYLVEMIVTAYYYSIWCFYVHPIFPHISFPTFCDPLHNYIQQEVSHKIHISLLQASSFASVYMRIFGRVSKCVVQAKEIFCQTVSLFFSGNSFTIHIYFYC